MAKEGWTEVFYALFFPGVSVARLLGAPAFPVFMTDKGTRITGVRQDASNPRQKCVFC
jgi:hypothetical protein